MLRSIFTFLFCLSLLKFIAAQPTGWQADNPTHVSFRYDAGNPWQDESSHWQPGILQFWTDQNYNEGSTMSNHIFRLNSPSQDMSLNRTSLVFQDNGGGLFADRVRLDYGGLNVVNGASWGAIDARVWGNGGQLDLYTGFNGNRTVWLGSTAQNSGRGNLRLYGPNGGFRLYDAVSSNNFGYSYFYGENGLSNVYIGAYSGAGNSNLGVIQVYDAAGTAQAGIYVDSGGQGIVWGDQKNFRIDDPTNSDRDIWYASLEGPEVAAYDRGTMQLVDGEAFVPFAEHFQIVSNTETMTVQLTPQEWDTYGLAVVEKTETGFRVKELKNGKGNFAFDWEVKCVRKGNEDFEIFRDKIMKTAEAEVDHSPGRFSKKVQGKAVEKHARSKSHQHGPGCVHHQRK